VARGLRGHHDHVQILARHDLVVVNGKAVGEGKRSALLHVGLDFFLVQLGLEFVRGQDHHHIGRLHGRRHIRNLQAVRLCLLNSGRAWTQTHHHINTGILQVAGMGMALGAVADDGDFLATDDGKVGVFVVIHLHGASSFFSSACGRTLAMISPLPNPLQHEEGDSSGKGLNTQILFRHGQYHTRPYAPLREWTFRPALR
jgi:hypothetical protein